tara:strand:- start:2145 stop:2753 length:609 start_codon:yes stop_codon:yes gene_type:complete
MANTYTGDNSGKDGLRVRESDGSPNVSGVSDVVLTAADFTITDDGNGTITLSTGAGGGNTLDQSYDEGGAGAGRTIVADNGAVAITGAGGLGVGIAVPVSLLEVAGASKLRQGFTVANPGAITLTAAAHSGAYIIENANVTITLPATSTIGEQYCFIATHSSGITIGRNGKTINGASSDVTVAQYKAKTAIAIGSNNWVVIG